MKIEELSIGDWVEVEGSPRQVRYIDGALKFLRVSGKGNPVYIGGVRPIPITAEILEKNGFEKAAICTTYLYNSDIEITLYGDGWWRTIGLDEYTLYRLDGVHQLQQAMRLAGVEKDIEV